MTGQNYLAGLLSWLLRIHKQSQRIQKNSSLNKNEKMRSQMCSRDDRSSATTNTKRVSFKGKSNFTSDGMQLRTNKPKNRITAPSLKSNNGRNELSEKR